jgi:hypothetical protein
MTENEISWSSSEVSSFNEDYIDLQIVQKNFPERLRLFHQVFFDNKRSGAAQIKALESSLKTAIMGQKYETIIQYGPYKYELEFVQKPSKYSYFMQYSNDDVTFISYLNAEFQTKETRTNIDESSSDYGQFEGGPVRLTLEFKDVTLSKIKGEKLYDFGSVSLYFYQDKFSHSFSIDFINTLANDFIKATKEFGLNSSSEFLQFLS